MVTQNREGHAGSLPPSGDTSGSTAAPTPEEVVDSLVQYAQAVLDKHEVPPIGDEQTRKVETMEARRVPYHFLQETVSSDTGLKHYEYAERHPLNPAQKIIREWDEGGDTCTTSMAFMNRPDVRSLSYSWHPTPRDHGMLRRRMEYLAAVPKDFLIIEEG